MIKTEQRSIKEERKKKEIEVADVPFKELVPNKEPLSDISEENATTEPVEEINLNTNSNNLVQNMYEDNTSDDDFFDDFFSDD